MGLIDNGSASFRVPDFYTQKEKVEKMLGRKVSRQEFIENYMTKSDGHNMRETGTSIFDPVLCETQYLWFSKVGDNIIDPFAGGSVRGIVAAELGRNYVGVDLREEQIEANRINADECCTKEKPTWICGDSLHIKDLANGEYDFLLTCPPYGNLEVYSDDPSDISNMSDDDFDETYKKIIANAVSMLKEDRFATVVVGNYRDKKGFMRDLVGLTVQAMESAGAKYYNDFIFITPVGSLPIRAGKQFQATRKMGRTHQYVLNFVKGNPKKATERLGDVEIPDMEQFVEEGDLDG